MEQKPVLSLDGILSYQHEFNSIDKLYSAYAYVLKELSESFQELYGVSASPKQNRMIEEMYYKMISVFSMETEDQFKMTEEDFAFFLNSDISWMNMSEQDQLAEGVDNFLETFISAEWARPDLNFLFLVSQNGFALRIETAGTFMGWYPDAEFLESGDYPFIESGEENTIQQPTLKPDQTNRQSRSPKRTNKEKRSFYELDELEAERLSHTIEDILKGEELAAEKPASNKEDVITETVKRFIGEIVMTGNFVHPLTPSEWQEVYDVLSGAVFLTIYSTPNTTDYAPTLKEVAKALYNDEGTGQVLASLYLLSQNIHAAKYNNRVERVHEVTALLRYYDWLKFDSGRKKDVHKVYDTLLNMTTTVLSGRI